MILRNKISLNKGKPSEDPFTIAKNQEFELITSHYFKSLICPKTPMEQSVESNSSEKFKAIASLPILDLYFKFFLEKNSQKIQSVNLDMGI